MKKKNEFLGIIENQETVLYHFQKDYNDILKLLVISNFATFMFKTLNQKPKELIGGGKRKLINLHQ